MRIPGTKESQHALHVANRYAVVAILPTLGHLLEEARGRHLLAVTYDQGLLAPEQSTEGVCGSHLTRLIKDDQVKTRTVRRDVLRHGKGAHHEDRLDALNRAPAVLHQLPYGHVPALLAELVPQGSKRTHGSS